MTLNGIEAHEVEFLNAEKEGSWQLVLNAAHAQVGDHKGLARKLQSQLPGSGSCVNWLRLFLSNHC